MGLITQEDPIGIAGGLNLYGYANGDPINFSDPFGLSPCERISDDEKRAECEANVKRGSAIIGKAIEDSGLVACSVSSLAFSAQVVGTIYLGGAALQFLRGGVALGAGFSATGHSFARSFLGGTSGRGFGSLASARFAQAGEAAVAGGAMLVPGSFDVVGSGLGATSDAIEGASEGEAVGSFFSGLLPTPSGFGQAVSRVNRHCTP